MSKSSNFLKYLNVEKKQHSDKETRDIVKSAYGDNECGVVALMTFHKCHE